MFDAITQLLHLAAISTVEISGVSVPTSIVVVSCLVVLCALQQLKPKKRLPWRTPASKAWLKDFRASRSKYTIAQRFAFIRKVDHFLWEEILMTCFEERGYRIARTKMTRDGGVDGYVTIDGELVAVQAKRYKGNISKAHVLALAELVERTPSISRGVFIHTGRTSMPIRSYFNASDKIDVIGGADRLIAFLDGEDTTLFGSELRKA